MTKIKFGTDGWRAIIAQDYTVDNLKRVAEGTARYLKKRGDSKVVVGFDTRFGGQLFAETTARVLGAYGMEVYMTENFVSTPMVSLGVVKLKADLGVMITASHNPPSYNGFKLKSSVGGPTLPADVAKVEAEVPDVCSLENLPGLEDLKLQGLLHYVDLEQIYLDHIAASFDLDLIKNSGIRLAYDAMYGAGQHAVRKLFPNATFLHCEYNPSFMGQAPEPIERNLREFAELLRNNDDLNLGLANDGDADRIGLFDEDGKFVDSHHILLLLLLYQAKYKGLRGKVVFTFSVTNKMNQLADYFGCNYEITKIGFKYIAEIMAREEVIVGGEESGGLAVKGHVPERDGIFIGLMIMEFMAKTGKSLKELIQEVYDIVGPFSYDRDDLHITNELKAAIIHRYQTDPYTQFGDFNVLRTEDIDGCKFILENGNWVLLRPSGTEPVLRVYAQAPSPEEVRAILDAVQETIL